MLSQRRDPQRSFYRLRIAFAAMLLLTAASVAADDGGSRDNSLVGFINDLGQPIGSDTLRRPLRLVVFGYTSCPDVCPTTLMAIHETLVKLGTDADGVDPMFVTVDPDRDSVKRLHQYVSVFDSRIRGYRAAPVRLDRFASRLNIRYWFEPNDRDPKNYGVSHTATLILLTRDGHIAARFAQQFDSGDLAKAIETRLHPGA